jgi:hypothetical protein
MRRQTNPVDISWRSSRSYRRIFEEEMNTNRLSLLPSHSNTSSSLSCSRWMSRAYLSVESTIEGVPRLLLENLLSHRHISHNIDAGAKGHLLPSSLTSSTEG